MSEEMGKLLSFSCRLVSCSAGSDKGADAEQRKEQADGGHRGLLFDCRNVGEHRTLPKFKLQPQCFRGEKKTEEADGDGDVHPEHAASFVGGAGGAAADDEDQSEDGGDERGGMLVAGADVTDKREDHEQEAKNNCQTCQFILLGSCLNKISKLAASAQVAVAWHSR